MHLNQLKIGVRLGLLGAFFFAALMVVAATGWLSMQAASTRSAAALARSVALSEAIDTARSAQVTFKIHVQDWKDILLRGNDPAALAKYRDAFAGSSTSTRAQLQALDAKLAALGLSTPLVAESLRTQVTLDANYLTALRQYDSSRTDSAHVVDALVKGMDREPTRKIDDIVAFIGVQTQRLTVDMALKTPAPTATPPW